MEPLRRKVWWRLTSPHAARYPAEMRDKDEYWHAILLYVLTPGINTTLVRPGQAPKSYQDLLDTKWKGKHGSYSEFGRRGCRLCGRNLVVHGRGRGNEYLDALSKQGVVNIEASSRAILDQVIAGEYPMVLMCFNNHTVISAARGAPSDWLKYEPVPVAFDAVSLLRMCRIPMPPACFWIF